MATYEDKVVNADVDLVNSPEYYAEVMGGDFEGLVTEDSSSVGISGLGITNYPLQAFIKLSNNVDNQLRILTTGSGKGLYSPPQDVKGEKGDTGEKGDPGIGMIILGVLDSTAELPDVNEHLEGDAWVIDGHFWVKVNDEWTDIGSFTETPGVSTYSDNANIIELRDRNGNTISFIDPEGNLYLKGMSGKSVQSAIHDVTSLIETDTSMYINVLTDAQKNVLQFTDNEFGETYVAGGDTRSLVQHVNDIKKRLSFLYSTRNIYDAVADFGIDNSGKNSCSRQVQAAIDFLSMQPLGGAIYFPAGAYLLHSAITPKDNVIITMAGWGKSRFLPVNGVAAFSKNPRPKNYLTNASFIDVEIDGELQFSYGYNSGIKGMYIPYFRDCLFLRNFIHDVGATGLGIDFADRSYILDGMYDNCGRLARPGNPGASGIGIGSGGLLDEPLIISRNICRNNKNFGIFFEWQRLDDTVYQSRQAIVSENICTGNYHAFGDCGMSGIVVTGNQFNDSVSDGVIMDTGTLSVVNNRPQPGADGIIANNQILRNGGNGIHYDATRVAGGGGYRIAGNIIANNQMNGIRHQSGDNTTKDMVFDGNDIKDNGGGAFYHKSGTLDNFDFMNNRLLRNNGSAMTFSGPVQNASISGNKIRDTQETPTQRMSLDGTGDLNFVDISENQYIGPLMNQSVDLKGTKSNVTFGRNPGLGE